MHKRSLTFDLVYRQLQMKAEARVLKSRRCCYPLVPVDFLNFPFVSKRVINVSFKMLDIGVIQQLLLSLLQWPIFCLFERSLFAAQWWMHPSRYEVIPSLHIFLFCVFLLIRLFYLYVEDGCGSFPWICTSLWNVKKITYGEFFLQTNTCSY